MFDLPFDFFSLAIAIVGLIIARKAFDQIAVLRAGEPLTAVGIKAELLVHLSACVPIPLISASACWLLLRGACPANRWLPPSMSVSRR